MITDRPDGVTVEIDDRPDHLASDHGAESRHRIVRVRTGFRGEMGVEVVLQALPQARPIDLALDRARIAAADGIAQAIEREIGIGHVGQDDN